MSMTDLTYILEDGTEVRTLAEARLSGQKFKRKFREHDEGFKPEKIVYDEED